MRAHLTLGWTGGVDMQAGWCVRRRLFSMMSVLLLAFFALKVSTWDASAQRQPNVPEDTKTSTAAPIAGEASAGRPESIQADVSTRSVAVTSSFNGTEIVVFGAIDNSKQASAEAGLYDVVIVVEGKRQKLIARRKDNIAGLWLNLHSVTFEHVPSYYAIVSTRPIDEVTDFDVLGRNKIGFESIGMVVPEVSKKRYSEADIAGFKESVVRLKTKEGLYRQEEFGVVFVGSSLFRATIELPANVPVGPMDARVFLFRDGKLLSQFQTQVNLQREGLEALLHTFAFSYSFLYGVFTVLLSVMAGLLASRLFDRARH